MRIKEITPKPYEKTVFPSILFNIEIEYKGYQEAIISVNGWLESNKGKILSNLIEFRETNRNDGISAKTSHSNNDYDSIYKTKLIAPLSKEALNYIEEIRKTDKKGDVYLTLCLNVKTLKSSAVISTLHLIDPKEIGLPKIQISTREYGKLVVWGYDPNYYSNKTNLWVISGNGNPKFLEINEYIFKEEIRIPSTDWIHDYAPKLGLGTYFIVEIPKGDEIIKEAWNYVEKAEECFRRWDIKGVCSNCREVGYLLDGTIKNKFGKDSFNYKERWDRAYKKFKDDVSLYLHLEEIKQNNKRYALEDIKGNKNDAEYILNMTKLLIKYAEELIKENNQ